MTTDHIDHIHQAATAAPTASMRRRELLLGTLGLGLGSGSISVRAETVDQYPSRPVRILLSNAAGTAPDVAARVLAERYQALTGKPFVVDNRPGAGGAICAEAVAGAPADGYTLLLGTMAEIALTPHLYKSLRYDVARDFAPVSEVGSADLLFVINPNIAPANSFAEYLTWARARQPLLVGTFGVGTPAHLAAAQLGDATGMKIEPVHYRAAGDGVAGISSGDIQGIFVSVALALPFIRSGKLKALALTAPTRSPVLPDVPTARELGLGHMEATYWFGMFASSKTPTPILDKLSEMTMAAVKAPEARKKLEEVGFRTTGTSRQDFAQMLAGDLPRWGDEVRRYGMRAD